MKILLIGAGNMGAAMLAGLAVGIWDSLESVRDTWQAECTFERQAEPAQVEAMLRGWRAALQRV